MASLLELDRRTATVARPLFGLHCTDDATSKREAGAPPHAGLSVYWWIGDCWFVAGTKVPLTQTSLSPILLPSLLALDSWQSV
jgi:hypothetical protein